MNTRQILSFKDYCFVLEQRKRESQDQSTRAGNKEIKCQNASDMKKTRKQ